MIIEINKSYIQCNKLIVSIYEIEKELETPGHKQLYQTTSHGVLILPNSQQDAL